MEAILLPFSVKALKHRLFAKPPVRITLKLKVLSHPRRALQHEKNRENHHEKKASLILAAHHLALTVQGVVTTKPHKHLSLIKSMLSLKMAQH